jgi:hypothetical protein
MSSRTAWTSAVALALFVAIGASAQELSCLQQSSWGSRGTPRDFASRGNHLFAADGRGVTTYDVSNPAQIREIAVTPTLSPSLGIDADGGIVAVRTRDGLEVFRATDSGLLELVGRREEGGSDVDVRGTLIATGGAELTLLRLSGAALELVARRASTREVMAVALAATHLYAAEKGTGIRVYEIGTGALREVGFVPGNALALRVAGDFLYTAAGGGGVGVYDISNPAAPRSLGPVALPDPDIRSVERVGAHLAAIDRLQKVHLLSLADPSAPRPLSELTIPSSAVVAVGDRLAAAGSRYDRFSLPIETGFPVQIFDITPTGELHLAGSFADRAGALTGVGLEGNYAFVADPPLLRVLDITGPTPREVARLEYGDSADRIHVENGYAVVYGRTETHLIDIREPLRPVHAGVFHTLGVPRSDVAFAGPTLIEANRASGFHVLDITNPAVPYQTSGLKNDGNGQWQGAAALDDVVYGMASFGIKVVDISNRAVAKIVKFIPTGSLRDVVVVQPQSGSPLLLAVDGNRVRIFDLTVRLDPVEISSVETILGIDIDATGSEAFVISAEGELVRIDLTNRSQPRVVNTVSGFFAPTQVSARNGLVAVADTWQLRILHFGGTAAPAAPLPNIVAGVSRRVASVEWTAVPGAVAYEVATSSDPAFTDPRMELVTSTSFPIRSDSRTFVRVRAIAGCARSEWSSAVEVEPFTGVAFGESGRRVIVRRGEAVTVQIPLTNRSSAAATAELMVTPTSSATIDSRVSVGPNAETSATLQVSSPVSGTLRVSGTAGGVTMGEYLLNIDVVDPQASSRQPAVWLIPGAGSSRGASGTHWKTDLELFCAEDCSFRLAYSDRTKPSEEQSVALSLRGGETVVIRNVVESIFGAAETTGTLSLQGGDAPSVRAAAYTYNDSPAGRYGQRVPARRVSNAGGTATLELLGVEESPAARTNLGFENTTGVAADIGVSLRNADGTEVATRVIQLPPFGSLPLYLRELSGSVDSGYVRITAPASIIAYASRIDARTGDAVFSYAVLSPWSDAAALPNRTYVFPFAGSTPGAGGSRWKTALQLRNPGTAPASARLTFVPAASSARVVAAEVELDAGELLAFDDVMSELFGAVPPDDAALGSIRVESDNAMTGWSRLFNSASEGTYGQFSEMREVSSARGSTVPTARAASAPGAQLFALGDDAAVRTNVILVEASGKPVAVRLKIYDGAGELVAIDDRVLEAYASAPLLRLLAQNGVSSIFPLRVEVERRAGEGSVVAYASRVENATNDAVTIAAQ